MKALTELKRATFFTGLLVLGACQGGTATNLPGIGGQQGLGAGAEASELTSINVSLPDRGALKNQVADIETRMDGYRLVVTPVDATCADATHFDQVQVWSGATLSASLKQGCDYDLTLALGHQGTSSTPTNTSSTPTSTGSSTPANTSSTPTSTGSSTPANTGSSTPANTGSSTPASTGGSTLADTVNSTQSNTPTSAANGAQTSATAPANSLGNVYYKNDTPLRIAKEDIAGKASLQVSIKLQLQPDGRTIGLGATVAAKP